MDAMNTVMHAASSLDKAYARIVTLCQKIGAEDIAEEVKKSFDGLDLLIGRLATEAFNHDRFSKT